MYKNAIVLGGNALNKGVVDNLRSLGFRVLVVDFREKIDLDCDEHIVFDAKDPDVANFLKESGHNDISLVYTSMDNAGLAQKEICKAFGLLHSDNESIICACQKDKMHQKWSEANILNRVSFYLEEFDYDKISSLNKKHKIIIKPSDSCASRGITILEKNSQKDAVLDAYNCARLNSTNDRVNIEEFVEGTEYTVEMMGDNYGNVEVFAISKKYHTKNVDNNKVAVKLHYNSIDVDDHLKEKIANYAITCYRSLGLKNTLGHLEVIVKLNGEITPIEIGSRSSGFIASHFTDISAGKSFIGQFSEVLSGAKVKNGLAKQSDLSSMYFFYDIPQDSVSKNETSIMKFLNPQIKSLYSDRKNLVKDKKFDKITQDTDRFGYEILVGPKNSLTIEKVCKAEQEFLKDFLYA